MIGDIFIGLLLIFSAAINLLAIGSFWVTPSLRTTTNRFVANLLIVNFLSCLVLSPAAFSPAITSSSTTSSNANSNDNNNNVNKSQTLVEYNNINASMLLINNNNVSSTQTSTTIQLDGDVMSVERIENIMERYQSCSLDFVVAVSVLSMLLVVMDTFIAVTDPLRYHSRISDLKAWILIGLCWIIGISVGIASALQSQADIISNENISSGGCVYNTMFLLTYFLSIILTPFLLVILMYWRIFTEARESGQRMRQNGSSPLLQSALNLATSATSGHQQNSSLQSQQNPLPSPQCLLLVTSPSLISCKQQQQQQSALNKQKTSDNNILSSSSSNSNINTASSKNNNTKVTTPPSTTDGLTMRIDKQDYYGVNNNLNQHDNYHQLPFSSETKTFLLSSPPHELMPILDTINETENNQPTKQSRQHQNILLTLTTACEAAATVKRNQSEKHLLTEDSSFFTSHDESKLLELRQVRSSPNLQLNSFEPNERRMNQTLETLELPQSVQASPKALRYMNSLRHRLSNASSLFKYREEGRAARISILVVIMFLLTYFPYGLLSLIHGQNNIIKESNLSFLSILFVLLANLCSPFIFAYRNKRVRKGVQRLLGIDNKTNERLEKLNSLKKSYSTRIKNYRQNQFNRSFNFGSSKSDVTNSNNNSQRKNNNIRRSQTFTACKYLTPPDANAKTTSNNSYQHQQQQQQQQNQHSKNIKTSINIKEKKSILKIVCDGSKKLALSNCQNGQQLETMMIGIEVDSNFIDEQQISSTRPVDV